MQVNSNLSDVTDKIKFYQKHPSKLEQISSNGLTLANDTFNEKKVISVFMEMMQDH